MATRTPRSDEEGRTALRANAQKRAHEATERFMGAMTTPQAAAFGKQLIARVKKEDPAFFKQRVQRSIFYEFEERPIRDRNYALIGKIIYEHFLLTGRQRHAVDMRLHRASNNFKPRSNGFEMTGTGRTEEWASNHAERAKRFDSTFEARMQSDPEFARRMRKMKEKSDTALQRHTRQRRFYRRTTGM